MSKKETKPKSYSEMSVPERYTHVEFFGNPIEAHIKGEKYFTSVEDFFVALHKLGKEIDKFIRHYFDETEPAMVIGYSDILNKVNKMQLMIKVR